MKSAIDETTRDLFIKAIELEYVNEKKYSSTTSSSFETLASRSGVSEPDLIQEYAELALVKIARAIAHSSFDYYFTYRRLVRLYEWQYKFNHVSTTTWNYGQYSTPAPIAYLAGLFVRAEQRNTTIFEPTAGNGLLTITALPEQVVVNEYDFLRHSNLLTQGFKKVFKQDANEPFPEFKKSFDAILANPPFAHRVVNLKVEGFPISSREHHMAILALDTMKDNGKAAILLGGHHEFDQMGRIRQGKDRIFYNYLYRFYHVTDVIQLDGKALYSKMGTSYNLRLILIDGRKDIPKGAAPLMTAKDIVINTFDQLFGRVMESLGDKSDYKYKIGDLVAFTGAGGKKYTGTIEYLKKAAWYEVRYDRHKLAIVAENDLTPIAGKESPSSLLLLETNHFKASHPDEKLEGYYYPGADSCTILDTVVPDSMDYETHQAVSRIKEKVGGDLAKFVMDKLHYASFGELCKSLSAEQIDAVALAVYNIEYKRQGMVVGDQTGIGKGRIAASMIRYAHYKGLKPIFLTEKPNLFSDLYRDLIAIGAGHLRPFIVNSKDSKTDIKDDEGKILYQALPETDQKRIFSTRRLPSEYDLVLSTYTQFNSVEKKPVKPEFLRTMAFDNIVIMDESHNASGTSNTGAFLQKMLASTRGVTFLSATFAKRPDNMPIYASKTAIKEANLSTEELIRAILFGGVALQEVLASQLVSEGQMIRRERSYEGVEVNYITLDDKADEHQAIADNLTGIIRDIIDFQLDYVRPFMYNIDRILAIDGKEISERKRIGMLGIDNVPYFNKVFNVINQLLFSIKAEAVADRAIMRLKEGKKPVIAFSSTMESFLEDMAGEDGKPVNIGDTINADFTEILKKGLEGVLRCTLTYQDGSKEYGKLPIEDFPDDAKNFYKKILQQAKNNSSGITISPIDVIVQKIERAGYKVAEVTGRKYTIHLNDDFTKGTFQIRKKITTNDAFRKFNNNEVDALLINQSGSTGASAHAIVTPKVPASQVKQRVMLVVQAEGNISTEVQKRGRINRTGQLFKPIYDYLSSAIPAEKRLMMMLQKKLKSLDANTSSNQKQSQAILNVDDFLNKYGDIVVAEYLHENKALNIMLDDPLKILKGDKRKIIIEDAARKVTGRVAVLSTKMQQDFYTEIIERYNSFVQYLKQTAEYDLEVEVLNLEAETIQRNVVKIGKGGETSFGMDSILEEVEANVLKKPFTRTELENLIAEALDGNTPEEASRQMISEYKRFSSDKLEAEIKEDNEYYDNAISKVAEEKQIKSIENAQEREKAISERREQLKESKYDNDLRARKLYENRSATLITILEHFKIGEGLLYPITDWKGNKRNIQGVFVGYLIDKKKKNPYALSAIKLRIALASNDKYLELPASREEPIQDIYDASAFMEKWQRERIRDNWEQLTRKAMTGRQIRYIVTGNLLQGLGTFGGKLVSYTLASGGENKGILMPSYWTPSEFLNNRVIAPIGRCLPLLRNLYQRITSENEIYIEKNYKTGIYLISVPQGKQRYGMYFLDQDLLALLIEGKFGKKKKAMQATFRGHNLDEMVRLLDTKFNLNMLLTKDQFADLKHQINEMKRPEGKVIPALLDLEARLLQMPDFSQALKGIPDNSFHPLIRYIIK